MTHRIRLLPSGREFEAEAQETLLDAALRNGVNIPYNCSGGSCGVCKARLISGRVEHPRFHDYVLSEADKVQGQLLLCSVSAGSDLVLEVNEIGDAAQIPLQQVSTRVAHIERVGEHYVILTLRTPRSQTLQFLAGQHVELRLGNGMSCDAAIASCPCNGMLLQFHLAQRIDEDFPRHVFQKLRANDIVQVTGPFGSFTLDEDSHRPIVMVAQDTGFAPLKSLIEHALALELSQPITLFWVSAHDDGFYLANLCRSWVDALDNFSYQPLYLEGGGETVTAEVIAGSIAAVGQCDFYLATGSALREGLLRSLTAHGAVADRIFAMEKRQCGMR
ncbi:2Fe-2S iron-sulfur cluster-binding protein [Sulfurivermis fontis]|uniref:2Fe-2S iron-sulfur cluster-binding protein n=1 Tax=Sulfurivermis fontis TaxID=1972068 RepID=UPI001559C5AB|nr:2Fe-2S iron-sulfur cluster-binding protein [Sulfurivermis fontis]